MLARRMMCRVVWELKVQNFLPQLPLVLKRNRQPLWTAVGSVLFISIMFAFVNIYVFSKFGPNSDRYYFLYFSFTFVSVLTLGMVWFLIKFRQNPEIAIVSEKGVLIRNPYLLKNEEYFYEWSSIESFSVDAYDVLDVKTVYASTIALCAVKSNSVMEFAILSVAFSSVIYGISYWFLRKKYNYFYWIMLNLREGKFIRRRFTMPVTSERIMAAGASDPNLVAILEEIRMKHTGELPSKNHSN